MLRPSANFRVLSGIANAIGTKSHSVNCDIDLRRPVKPKNNWIRILSATTKNIGNIALLKPVLDGVGIAKIVDSYAPVEREGNHLTNGQAIEVIVRIQKERANQLRKAVFCMQEWQKSEYAITNCEL